MRRALAPVMLFAIALVGCDLINPERPTPQPDVTLFGNLLEVTEPTAVGGAWTVTLQVGVPRALAAAQQAEGRPTPVVEKGTVAEVTLDGDTVVLVDGRPGSLAALNPGSEVVAVPVPGTTRMAGSARIFLQAEYFTDFATYRRWNLPGLEKGEPTATPNEDTARINSAGIEESPVPVGSGRVLYFSARLRLPEEPKGRWLGARRPGLGEPAEGGRPLSRSYRTERGADGWSAPELVELPGVDAAASVRVTWVSDDESRCLVTVEPPDQKPWVGTASRADIRHPWGAVEAVAALGGGDSADGVYLAGSKTKIAFASTRGGATGSDLYLWDPKQGDVPQPLDPRINTPGEEWRPRVGPQNALFFCRGDRQLVLSGGSVRPVRLPGPFRREANQAAPTGDGGWLFLVVPRYTPVEVDLDIVVAPIAADGSVGEPVPVDDWRE